MIRIVICWSQITGYTAACWRALAAQEGVELYVILAKSVANQAQSAFNEGVAAGLNCRFLAEGEKGDCDLVARLVIEAKPDVIVLCGWFHPPYNQLISRPELSDKKFIMGMDTPWQGTWRQRLGRLKLGRFLDRMDRVVVSGERSRQLAQALKVPEYKLKRGVYGIDFNSFSQAYPVRRVHPEGWPKRFLFTGRYHEVKAIDVLLKAYTAYRASVANPWPLTMCGTGPLEGLINTTPGVENLGFVQPADQTALYARHGVFVLASRFDPWPLVIVEACAAGLPVICTEACGSAVELLRTYYNGLTVPTDNVAALTGALRYMHTHHADLPEMGRRSLALAEPFGADFWARRWIEMIDEVCPLRRQLRA